MCFFFIAFTLYYLFSLFEKKKNCQYLHIGAGLVCNQHYKNKYTLPQFTVLSLSRSLFSLLYCFELLLRTTTSFGNSIHLQVTCQLMHIIMEISTYHPRHQLADITQQQQMKNQRQQPTVKILSDQIKVASQANEKCLGQWKAETKIKNKK